MEDRRSNLVKWLQILLYCEIAALAFALLEYIPGDNTLFTWLQRICQGGSLVCLFAVAFAGKRYLTAAVLGSVQLVLTVAQFVIIFFFQLLLMQGILHTDDFKAWSNFCAVLNLIAMVAGWIYTYQLYHAHGNLIKEQDATLWRKWHHLFFWSLAAGIGVTLCSMIFFTIYTDMGLNNQTILTLYYSLIDVPGQIITLMGIIYLHRTIQIIQTQEE